MNTDSFIEGLSPVLSAIGGVAFLSGPVAVLLLGGHAWVTGQRSWQKVLPTAVLLSLLSVTVAGVAAGSGIIQAFAGIAETGSGGVMTITPPVELAVRRLLYGLLAVGASVLVAGFVLVRRGGERMQHSASSRSMRRRSAVGFSVLVLLAAVGADQYLRLHHRVIALFISIVDPLRLGGDSSPAQQGAVFAESVLRLVIGGGLGTLALVGGSVVLWRVSRSRQPDGLLSLTCAVALILMLVAGGWHVNRLNESADALRSMVERASVAEAPRRP